MGFKIPITTFLRAITTFLRAITTFLREKRGYKSNILRHSLFVRRNYIYLQSKKYDHGRQQAYHVGTSQRPNTSKIRF
jgi:hypothetical protein